MSSHILCNMAVCALCYLLYGSMHAVLLAGWQHARCATCLPEQLQAALHVGLSTASGTALQRSTVVATVTADVWHCPCYLHPLRHSKTNLLQQRPLLNMQLNKEIN